MPFCRLRTYATRYGLGIPANPWVLGSFLSHTNWNMLYFSKPSVHLMGKYITLSYDLTAFEGIMLCNKYVSTRYIITFVGTCTIMKMSMTTILFFIEIMSTLKEIKSHFI